MRSFTLYAHRIIVLISLTVFANIAIGQIDSVPVNNDKTIVLNSAVLHEQRTIWVHLPEGYEAGSKTYPVLYLLDGEGHFKYASQLVDYLASYDRNRIPEMIVVAILNVDRTRDFTPIHSLYFGGKIDSARMAATGGGAKFLDFIQNELVPHIDKHFRTQPYRILGAHSLGGLFGLYAMQASPGLFAANILMSPAIYGGNQKVLDDFRPYLSAHRNFSGKLFISIGDENRKAVDSLIHIIKLSGSSKIDWQFRQYKDENHFSVTYKSLFDGLKYFYRHWFIDNYSDRLMSWKEIDVHFERLSTEFGYIILPAEEFANNAGYKQLRAIHLDAAIEIFRQNTLLYPTSWNAFDSLGEAYAAQGKRGLAVQSYERSIALNPGNEDGKKALKRLKEKP